MVPGFALRALPGRARAVTRNTADAETGHQTRQPLITQPDKFRLTNPVRSALLALLTALAGLAVLAIPPLASLETEAGLKWLFGLRGARPAPPDVVVVSVDQASSARFGLANDPEKWPRSHHARLVDRLTQLGAAVVAFDVIFEETRDPGQNARLAAAMRAAGNVILFEYLERSRPAAGAGLRQLGIDVSIQKAREPLPELADAAAALAPFPLPKVPARVNQFWTFKTGAGDAPTLPAVALQHFSLQHRDAWRSVLAPSLRPGEIETLLRFAPGGNSPDSARLALETRRLFLRREGLANEVRNRIRQHPGESSSVLLALTSLYEGPDSHYLDFYGPPQSVLTIPFHTVLEGPVDALPDLRGKAVFVGFSEQLQPEQKDGFYTVFSQKDGLDVSGVEIAATAFGNLLEMRTLKPLDWRLQVGLICLLGILFPVLFMWLPGPFPVPAAAVAAFAWMALSERLFTSQGVWLPIVAPLLFQLPVALIGALLWRMLSARRERQRIRESFGYFLPRAVVDELSDNLADIPARGGMVHGVCLATDAERYTELAELMPPDRLREFLNEYYRILFQPVRDHGGIVCDVVGDAMMAIWAAPSPDSGQGARACLAALAILDNVDAFNEQHPESPLPTRIGLHGGQFMLGSVGASDHFEYRAVGDIVNAASRIEGLNKRLGTRVLISGEVAREAGESDTRDLGRFRLTGKRKWLEIHQLSPCREAGGARARNVPVRFDRALAAFRGGDWQKAREMFRSLHDELPLDGPIRFYFELCESFETDPPPAPFDGIVTMKEK